MKKMINTILFYKRNINFLQKKKIYFKKLNKNIFQIEYDILLQKKYLIRDIISILYYKLNIFNIKIWKIAFFILNKII